MLKSFFYCSVLVSVCFAATNEQACTVEEQKRLYDDLLRKEIFTQVPKCFSVPFDDQVDSSGLNRYPIHVAIQTGDTLCVVNNFLKFFKLSNETDFATNLLVKDGRGWGVLEYAAAYQPSLLETLFRYLAAARIVPAEKIDQPVPPIFSNEVRDRILRIALRDATKTTCVIKSIREYYGCVSKTISLFSPDAEQESFGLLEANMKTFMESVLLAPNPASRLGYMVKENQISMLKKFLDVFSQLKEGGKAVSLGEPEFLGGLLHHAFQKRNVDIFMVLNEAFPEALPAMIKSFGLILLQNDLKSKIISAVILESLSKVAKSANSSSEEEADKKEDSGSKVVDLKELMKSRGEEIEIFKETELVFKAMFEGEFEALKDCANEVVDQETNVTVFEVAVAYRDRKPFKSVELDRLFGNSGLRAVKERMIWKLFNQSKRERLSFTAARRIWVLRILVKLMDLSLLEYFAYYSRSFGYVQELKFLATEMIQSGEQTADYLFCVLLANCHQPQDLVKFFQYLCRLQRGTSWINRESFERLLDLLGAIKDKESLKSLVDFTDFIELVHDSLWFSKDWSIDRGLLERFVTAYPEAELLLHISK